MKNLFLLICFFAFAGAIGQDKRQATMEKRANELHRVMGLNEKEQWKKFMTGELFQILAGKTGKVNH